MADLYKSSNLQEKMQQTSDQIFNHQKPQDFTKSAISSLIVTLNSKKTQLRSSEFQASALKQKLTELDLQTDKNAIAHQYLCAQSDQWTQKNNEALCHKRQLLKQVKDWKQARDGLSKEVLKDQGAIKDKRKQIHQLQQKGKILRQKIKAKQLENKEIFDYNLDLDFTIQKSETQVKKMRQDRDSLCKTALTLQTFAKSFKKNIQAKQQQLLRSKFDIGQLQNLIVSKGFQKTNLEKEKDQCLWQCKLIVNHNVQIQQTNQKLKVDLQKLMGHLQALKRNNKCLSGCIKQFSDTGVKAAKRILQVANK